MKEKIPKPILLALEVTRHCRFHCAHCKTSAAPEGTGDELSQSQWKKILKAIAAYNKCAVVFTGGEPMERGDIYNLISFGKELGLRVMLATCGYLIDEKTILKLKQAGVSMLSLSIDGESAATHDAIRQSDGSFDAVIKAAQFAREAKIPFQINSAVTKTNIDEVNAIALLAMNLGARCYNPFVLSGTGEESDIREQLLDTVEYETLLNRLLELKLSMPIEIKVTCSPALARFSRLSRAEKRVSEGGNGTGFINYKGDVFVCGFFGISAGNIIEEKYKFKKLWENLNSVVEKPPGLINTEKCSTCRARAYVICKGVRKKAGSIANIRKRK